MYFPVDDEFLEWLELTDPRSLELDFGPSEPEPMQPQAGSWWWGFCAGVFCGHSSAWMLYR